MKQPEIRYQTKTLVILRSTKYLLSKRKTFEFGSNCHYFPSGNTGFFTDPGFYSRLPSTHFDPNFLAFFIGNCHCTDKINKTINCLVDFVNFVDYNQDTTEPK